MNTNMKHHLKNVSEDVDGETHVMRELSAAMHKNDALPRVLVMALLGVTVAVTAYAVNLRLQLNQSLAATTKSSVLPKTIAPAAAAELEEAVLPSKGVVLPLRWGDMGQKLVKSGAIDLEKFRAIYAERGGISPQDEQLVSAVSPDQLVMTRQNAQTLLNLFWAFGLANKNEILEKGPMMDPRYGGADKFASTGGWTVSKGNAMNHYSKHMLVTLTNEQQELVKKVAGGVYRPCCNNSTIFPDCNHGMAMLGMLELMAAQGATEQDMWNAALAANSFWFPNNYLTIATYFKNAGTSWKNVSPQTVLGAQYSSASGYKNISTGIIPPTPSGSGGGGCSVSLAPAIRRDGLSVGQA